VTVAPPTERAPDSDSGHPVRSKFGRRKFDKQPDQPAAVLIASNGVTIPGAAVRLALRMSGGQPVAVVSIARLFGSSFGLQNRGLLPTQKELTEQKDIVGRAVASIEKGGGESWGQVAITRKPAKTIAAAARARGAGHVIVVRSEQRTRWRRVVEGDLAKEVARKLGTDVEVEGVSP
jgi:nucleotide-binding universal stress UspA family protein